MTLDTAYRLGQFANKLMEKAPDLYKEFEKLVRDMLEESAPDKVSIPSQWDVRPIQIEDPLNPWNVTCEANTLKAKDMPKSDFDIKAHCMADTVTSCNQECAV